MTDFIFVIGGACQGKREYVKNTWPDAYVAIAEDVKSPELFLKDVIKEAGEEKQIVLIATEMGYGLVPMDAKLRDLRERNGRTNCFFASKARKVVRITCGIPQVIKDVTIIGEVYLIRHGSTAGNLTKCFVGGRTDEPLCPEGIEALKNTGQDLLPPNMKMSLYTSPMQRCRQTAQLLFPDVCQTVVEDLRECDFGILEGKNHEQLLDDPEYVRFIEEENAGQFPGGECIGNFLNRCADAFGQIMDEAAKMHDQDHIFAFVVHGGTCMGIMNRFAKEKRPYYKWSPENGKGYKATAYYDESGRLCLSDIQDI